MQDANHTRSTFQTPTEEPPSLQKTKKKKEKNTRLLIPLHVCKMQTTNETTKLT